VEMCELRTQINAATPESAAAHGVNRDVVSEECERLRHSLASLTASYNLITSAVDNSPELAHVLEGINTRNTVDIEWLSAQKVALAALETEKAAQPTYERRERTAVTAMSYEPAYEPEQNVDHSFGIEPGL
jgi:hypothetical protein